MWVERASGVAAVGILQSELVPWIKLLKAHSLPSLCTRAPTKPEAEGLILRGGP